MGTSKKTPKRKSRSVKDLAPTTGGAVTGGRQTSGASFGAIVKDGISKVADVAITTTQST